MSRVLFCHVLLILLHHIGLTCYCYPGAKTKYFNFDDMREFLIKHKNLLTIFSLNIESMNTKYDEFKILIESLAEKDAFISVICIQEAWLTKNSEPKQFELQHYNMLSQCNNYLSKPLVPYSVVQTIYSP